MSDAVEAKISELTRITFRVNQLKEQVQRFKEFLETVNADKLVEIGIRKEKIEPVLQEYDLIQSQIEILNPNKDYYQERQEFENMYFEAVALAETKLSVNVNKGATLQYIQKSSDFYSELVDVFRIIDIPLDFLGQPALKNFLLKYCGKRIPDVKELKIRYGDDDDDHETDVKELKARYGDNDDHETDDETDDGTDDELLPKKKRGSESDSDDDYRKSKKGKTDGGSTKGGSEYTKPVTLSPELAALVGENSMAKYEVVRRVYAIIKEKDLYDPNNKQYAICDDAMMKVFGVKCFRTFGMMTYLKTHFISKNV